MFRKKLTAIAMSAALTTGLIFASDYTSVNAQTIKAASVQAVRVTTVSLSKSKDTLTVGGADTLKATVAPSNATNKAVTWTSSNSKVVTVANGVIKAVGVGTATIKATTVDGKKTVSCIVTVNKLVRVTAVALNKNKDTLTVGGTDILKETIAPSNATNKGVAWTTSNAKVVTVTNGVIKAVGKGTAVISATTVDGKKVASCTVTVNTPVVPTTITVNANNYNDIYNGIKAALIQGKDLTINSSSTDLAFSTASVVNKVLADYPELKIISSFTGSGSGSSNSATYTLKFVYFFANSQVAKINSDTYQKAEAVVNSLVKPGMTDLEKELAIHDYIVNNTTYDDAAAANPNLASSRAAYTAYGSLINGKAVCQGYADTLSLLLRLAGIKSYFVVGTANGGSHAWNIVLIGGQYYQVDSTFDDPEVTMCGARIDEIRHTYFNITDTQLSKDHSWDKNSYPKATSTKFQYFNLLDKTTTTVNSGWIYYENSSDNNRLYKMKLDGTSITKLTDDSVGEYVINGNNVYYTSSTNGNNLFSMDISGNSKKCIVNKKISNLILSNGYLYFLADGYKIIDDGDYQYSTEINSLSRLQLSDGSVKTLNDDNVGEFKIYNGYFVYANMSDNRTLYRATLDGNNKVKLANDYAFNIWMKNDWVYYLNVDSNNKIYVYKVKIDGTGRQKVTS